MNRLVFPLMLLVILALVILAIPAGLSQYEMAAGQRALDEAAAAAIRANANAANLQTFALLLAVLFVLLVGSGLVAGLVILFMRGSARGTSATPPVMVIDRRSHLRTEQHYYLAPKPDRVKEYCEP